MSCLITFLTSRPDDDDPGPSLESYPLHELRPMHIYPPPPQPVATSTSAHTYPPESALPDEDLRMSLYNPWEAICRMRDDEDDRVSLAIFILVSQLTNI